MRAGCICLFVYLRIGSEGWWLVWRAAAACLPLIIVNQRTGSWDGQNFSEKILNIFFSDLAIFLITVFTLGGVVSLEAIASLNPDFQMVISCLEVSSQTLSASYQNIQRAAPNLCMGKSVRKSVCTRFSAYNRAIKFRAGLNLGLPPFGQILYFFCAAGARLLPWQWWPKCEKL